MAGTGCAGARRVRRPGWDHEPRVLLQEEIEAAGVPALVGTTHLPYLPWRSVRQLRRALRAQAGDAPAVLMGDFNLPPRVVRTLSPRWRHAGGDFTFPSTETRIQLDHILVRRLDVLDVQVAAAGPSDHRAVVADVAVTS